MKKISVNYGSVQALEKVSFTVKDGEIVAIIGPNGAGKSTALKAIFGIVPITEGDIFFNYENIKGLRPDEHVPKGISLMPEGRHLFPSMTVLGNLEMGAFARKDCNPKTEAEAVLEMFPSLKDKRRLKAGGLSTGEQQLLSMGRALMQKPMLLLADEPSLGLSPTHIETVLNKLIEINKMGTSVLLVEQNARMALEIAHKGYIFKMGQVFMEGTGQDLLGSDEVRKAFLWGGT